jgi:trehalose-6-phosphate synthase
METYRWADIVLATPWKGNGPGIQNGDGYNLSGAEVAAASLGGLKPWLVISEGAGAASVLRSHGAQLVRGGDIPAMAELMERLMSADRKDPVRLACAARYEEFAQTYTSRHWIGDQMDALREIWALKADIAAGRPLSLMETGFSGFRASVVNDEGFSADRRPLE